MKAKEKAMKYFINKHSAINSYMYDFVKVNENAIDIALKEQAKEMFKDIENYGIVFDSKILEELKKKYGVKE